MARVHLYIAVMSLCVIASACSKAKMRTVPRQAPAAGAGLHTSPDAPPPGSEEQVAPVPPPAPESVSRPAPAAPAAPVTRLDADEPRRVSGPRPAPRREVIVEEREVIRPRPRPRREVIVEDCPPEQRREIVRPEPRPRRPVVVVEEAPAPRREVEQRQQFELDPADELHCRWEPTGKPMTYLKYDPTTKTAHVQHGWPQKWNRYTQVRLVSGLPPYGNEGLSMVSKSGVPIAHLKPTGNGTIWYERGTSYPYESYFGKVPGAPQGEAIRGVCWTKSEQPVTSESSGGN